SEVPEEAVPHTKYYLAPWLPVRVSVTDKTGNTSLPSPGIRVSALCQRVPLLSERHCLHKRSDQPSRLSGPLSLVLGPSKVAHSFVPIRIASRLSVQCRKD